MNRSVYIETSVISYLTARPTQDLNAAHWQALTVEWWDHHRGNFRLLTSELVFQEASGGDPEAAQRRLDALDGIALLPASEEAMELAARLVTARAIPSAYANDAVHLALAAVNDIDLLLTWNCRHLHNPVLQPVMRHVCAEAGFTCPELCTPIELLGVD